ncbi:MAG: dihydroneopterin aldolase [Ferruginibacter sp.]
MVSVQLHNLLFNAFHGIHQEEKIIGNEYMVDAILEFHEMDEEIEHIDETINYATLYDIIKYNMSIPTPLLETVVMKTGNEIHKKFPEIKSISISIKKMNPPIEGMRGFAEVCWNKKF